MLIKSNYIKLLFKNAGIALSLTAAGIISTGLGMMTQRLDRTLSHSNFLFCLTLIMLVFSDAYAQNNCADISGTWSATENGSVTCTAQGASDSVSISGTAPVTIIQNGCYVSYIVPGAGGGISRNGTVDGRNIQFSGNLLAAPPGLAITFSKNSAIATGTINNINRFDLSGSGQAAGTINGIPATCSGTSTAIFIRTPQINDPDNDLVGISDNCPTIPNFAQIDTDGDGRGDACDIGEVIVTGDLDGNGLDEVILDFGIHGTWVYYNNATWVQLHNLSPETLATGDMDGNGLDEVIFDFGIHGTWVRFNDATWVKLHNLSPETLATGDMDGNSLDEVILGFGIHGTWVRNNNAAWVQLLNLSPGTLATGDMDGDGQDEVILEFDNHGTWVRYNNTIWAKLHNLSPETIVTGDMDGNGLDEVILDFGIVGTWVRSNNATWTKLHDLSPGPIVAGDMDGNGLDEVILDFGILGTWMRFNDATWVKLHSVSSVALAAGDMDGNGKDEVILDFGVHGTWVRFNNATWVKLHSLSPGILATDQR